VSNKPHARWWLQRIGTSLLLRHGSAVQGVNNWNACNHACRHSKRDTSSMHSLRTAMLVQLATPRRIHCKTHSLRGVGVPGGRQRVGESFGYCSLMFAVGGWRFVFRCLRCVVRGLLSATMCTSAARARSWARCDVRRTRSGRCLQARRRGQRNRLMRMICRRGQQTAAQRAFQRGLLIEAVTCGRKGE
jgi:hypothetical protein